MRVVDILVALVVVITVAVLVHSSFRSARDAQVLQSANEDLVSLLATARSLTLASQENSRYGVHLAGNTATLFKGASYTPTGAVRSVSISPTLSVSWSLAGGGADVIFARLSGATGQNGTVTLTLLAGGGQKTITVEPTGIAWSN